MASVIQTKEFVTYQSPLESFEVANERFLGILEPGLIRGFDSWDPISSNSFTLLHTNTGINKVSKGDSPVQDINKTGVIYTKQGSILHFTNGVGTEFGPITVTPPAATTNSEFYIAVAIQHKYTENANGPVGTPVTYEVSSGQSTKAAAKSNVLEQNPQMKVVIGYLHFNPQGASQTTDLVNGQIYYSWEPEYSNGIGGSKPITRDELDPDTVVKTLGNQDISGLKSFNNILLPVKAGWGSADTPKELSYNLINEVRYDTGDYLIAQYVMGILQIERPTLVNDTVENIDITVSEPLYGIYVEYHLELYIISSMVSVNLTIGNSTIPQDLAISLLQFQEGIKLDTGYCLLVNYIPACRYISYRIDNRNSTVLAVVNRSSKFTQNSNSIKIFNDNTTINRGPSPTGWTLWHGLTIGSGGDVFNILKGSFPTNLTLRFKESIEVPTGESIQLVTFPLDDSKRDITLKLKLYHYYHDTQTDDYYWFLMEYADVYIYWERLYNGTPIRVNVGCGAPATFNCLLHYDVSTSGYITFYLQYTFNFNAKYEYTILDSNGIGQQLIRNSGKIFTETTTTVSQLPNIPL